MAPEEKKNIFDKAIDLVSNRDEKAAAEEANLKAMAAKEAAARADAEKVAAQKTAADAQAKLNAMEAEKATEARNEGIKKMLDAQKAAEILTTHTVAAGETLGGIALKYYKSSTRDSWMKIYEANKAVIGDNPGMIKAGQELKIPKA